MKTLLKLAATALIAALASSTAACGPEFERIELSGNVQDGLGSEIRIEHLTVHQGLIVKSHVVAWNDDNEQMGLTLTPVDPTKLEIVGVITAHDYAFIGKEPGRTQVRFVADGELVLTMEVDVLPQPELPPE